MKSQKWRDKLADKTLTLGDFEDALLEWDSEVLDLETKLEDFEEAREPEPVIEYVHVADWGNCIRGCPPAYLNKNGFCSPNCERGWPRGEFVTVPMEVSHQ